MKNIAVCIGLLLSLMSIKAVAENAPADPETGSHADTGAEDEETVTITVKVPSISLEEVIVLGVFKPTEDDVGIERYATSIISAIDIEQLERFGDSDIAAALGRLVGVTVTDSKYANVRGLDGRYISASLNGLLMPSTDPLRRDVQLDLFPTNILGGIEIQKSYTPDQLATTTGGSIKILTKGLPDDRVHKVSSDLGLNADFTGSDVMGHAESETELLGFDNGLRDLPGGVLEATDGGTLLNVCDPSIDPVRCTSPLDAARLGVQFQDDYNHEDNRTAYPDVGLGWSFGDRLLAGNNEWGYYLALNYGRSTSDRGDAKLDDPLETAGEYHRSGETVSANAYAVVGYEYGVADELLSKTAILRSTDHTTRLEEGIDDEDNAINNTILQYVERQFFSQAFTGHNEFDSDSGIHILDWRLAFSRTNRDEPDRRQYTYLNNTLSTSSFERRWSDLEEDSLDVGVDYTFPLEWGNYNITEIKAGVLWSDKEREVELYRFSIARGSDRDVSLHIDQDLEKDVFSYRNFALDRFRIRPTTTDTDSYNSVEETQAYYLHTDTSLGDDWSFGLGARYEELTQKLEYPNEATATNVLEVDDWYPSVSLTWRPVEDWQFRLGWSETVSYPGLIERSESLFYDPETDDPIFGTPSLKASAIENLDARVEYYFSDAESISLAVFAKDIDQPIERAIPDASGSAADGVTFRNQKSAELFGVELDFNKDVLDGVDSLLWLGGNVSYIDSEVALSADSLRLEGATADGRQLQGQSEWLANFQVGYDHYPTEQKLTLLVNYFDDRIFRISRGARTKAQVESGRVLVDLTYSKLFGDALTLEAQIKNLFNEEVEYARGGRSIESYQTGTAIKVGVTYEFF